MTTLTERAAAASAKIQQLLKQEDAPKEEQLAAPAAVARIAEMLGKTETTAEQRALLTKKLEEIGKMNWEQTSTVSVPVFHDKDQLDPTPPKAMPVTQAPADSTFANNAVSIGKKLEEAVTKTLVQVSKATAKEKLTEIMDMFGIKDSDFDEQWQLRCKIGDAVQFLYQMSQLENMGVSIGSGASTATEGAAEKTAKAAAADEGGWPSDMAAAKYDPEKKIFKRDDPTWGLDSQRS